MTGFAGGTFGSALRFPRHAFPFRRTAMADAAPDAITLLKNDHREVEDLFKEFEKASGPATKRKIAGKISTALIVHTRIENEIFYPACEGKVEDADLKEAYVEHD